MRVGVHWDGPLVTPPAVSENCVRHTRQPAGYQAWHAWAEQMSGKHEQVRCPGCGLFNVWVRKGTADA